MGLQRNLSSPQQIATGALNEAIAQGDWRLMFLQHDRLEDIGPSDVLRVAQAYFKDSNLTIGYYKPDDSPDRTVVPATPDLASLFDQLQKQRDGGAWRGIRSYAGEYRKPADTVEAGEWDESGGPAEEDREQHCRGDH